MVEAERSDWGTAVVERIGVMTEALKDYVMDVNKKVDLERAQDPFTQEGTTKVFLAEPSGGQVDIIIADNRKDFCFELSNIQHNSNFRFFSGTTGRMHVSFARDEFARKALEIGADWILFYDDDQYIPRKMFQALMRHGDKYDIIVPLIFQRVHPYKPVVYTVNYSWTKDEKTGDSVFKGKTEHIMDYPINHPFEVDAAGTGVMLVRTEVFKKVPEPWFFSNTSLGEDIWFCLQAKKLGFKILCDPRIKVGHLGNPRVITEIEFLMANKKELEKIRAKEIEVIEESLRNNKEPDPVCGVFDDTV